MAAARRQQPGLRMAAVRLRRLPVELQMATLRPLPSETGWVSAMRFRPFAVRSAHGRKT
jgi:hypothetical protein